MCVSVRACVRTCFVVVVVFVFVVVVVVVVVFRRVRKIRFQYLSEPFLRFVSLDRLLNFFLLGQLFGHILFL